MENVANISQEDDWGGPAAVSDIQALDQAIDDTDDILDDSDGELETEEIEISEEEPEYVPGSESEWEEEESLEETKQ